LNYLFRHANNYRTYGIANFAAAVNPHETIRPRLYCSPQITLKKHAWQKYSCQGLIKGPPGAYTKVPGRAPRVSKMDDSLDGGGGGQGAAVKVCSACYKKKSQLASLTSSGKQRRIRGNVSHALAATLPPLSARPLMEESFWHPQSQRYSRTHIMDHLRPATR